MSTTETPLAGQRLVVFAPDIPWPANRGGRADVWRRIQALRSQGAAVLLVHLYEAGGPLSPTPADWAHVKHHVDAHECFPMKRGRALTLRRLLNARRVPWHAATRVPEPVDEARIRAAVQAFAPTAMWLEGPWFGELACKFADAFAVPLAYRSHNVEHRYLLGQARAAKRLRDQLAWRLTCVGLAGYEHMLMRRADAVFDISIDDMAFWQGRGIQGAHWLPPLPEMAMAATALAPVPGDIVFSGNLRTPNNLLGLRWLVGEVMPRVWQQAPEARLRVVGSSPSAELRDELARLARVDTDFDVPSVQPFVLGARVLANPVFVGSGVQLKTLDMLSTDAPIVTRAQGLRGLPAELRSLLRVADDADAFAQALIEARAAADPWLQGRAGFRRQFSAAGIAQTVGAALAACRPSSGIGHS
ncbi:glycosyltransferase family 4 protein [Roseateles sp. LKC17W]|uniref:Glycosyltransferase family 4 protein n=1 Tax=Pelomonas margarita TaxID=3299031 RepID=A0ABW7FQ53_9BURK